MSERDQGKRMLREISGYNLHRSWKVRRPKACLLVIDMQNYFAHPDGSAYIDEGGHLVRALKGLIQVCRKRKVPVIYTRHSHRKDGSEVGILGEWWGESIYEGTWASELVDELGPGRDELVIDKNRYSAFFGTDLEKVLRDMGVEDVMVSGVMTNVCCETTARDAFMRDFKVFFLADGNTSADGDMHMNALKGLAFAFAVVKTIDEIVKELDQD